MKTHLRSTLSLLLGALVALPIAACGSTPKAPPPAPAPEPIVVIKEEPLPSIAGDEQVPERFKRSFGEFLKGAEGGGYARVIEVREVSNAVAIVLERRLETLQSCRVGPSTLEIVDDEGERTTDVVHFGEDCCPGTTCEMGPMSWNLRYLKALADDDLGAFAALVPAKKKLKYKLVAATESGAPKTSKQAYSRKDIAAGKFKSPPDCGFVDTRPSCREPDVKTGAFQCACDGGGYHVTYDWEKEGEGYVLVAIDESSS